MDRAHSSQRALWCFNSALRAKNNITGVVRIENRVSLKVLQHSGNAVASGLLFSLKIWFLAVETNVDRRKIKQQMRQICTKKLRKQTTLLIQDRCLLKDAAVFY